MRSPERLMWSAHSKPPQKKLLNWLMDCLRIDGKMVLLLQAFEKIQCVFKSLVHIEILVIGQPAYKIHIRKLLCLLIVFFINTTVAFIQDGIIRLPSIYGVLFHYGGFVRFLISEMLVLYDSRKVHFCSRIIDY